MITRRRALVATGLAGAAVVATAGIALFLGAAPIGATDVVRAVLGRSPSEVTGAIVATAVLSLARVTSSPPAGAGRDSVTVTPSVRPTPTSGVPPPITWPATVRVMSPGCVGSVVVVVDVAVVVLVVNVGGQANS